MENIKKRSNRAYVLLESLIALGLLAMLTTFTLTDINSAQKQSQALIKQNEALNIAKMAMDSNQPKLTANGVSISLLEESKNVIVRDLHGKELLHLEILEIQK
ncbi:MAG: hypothetical protein LBI13_00980 [Streptococcaceae bacterium]|nr:hypothetical protein [Streptococcaceae bacterium]